MKFLLAGVLVLAIAAHVKAVCKDSRSDCMFMKIYCPFPSFKAWLTRYCPATCGFCSSVTPPPRTQPPIPTGGGNTFPPQGACGKAQFANSRVIAGTTARRGSWPWQILMTYNSRPSCGGTIIGTRWILTAAHCVSGKEFNVHSFKIRVGEHNTQRREGSETDLSVERIVTNSNWNRRTMNNDIALIKVSRPIKFNQYVQPACLPSSDPPVGAKCYITGWGKIRHPGSMHNLLQQTILPVVSNKQCEQLNRKTIPISITSAMICGGNAGRTRQSGCHGDSGGPYVCQGSNGWEVHGAVSHGASDCDSQKTYTVFSRVNHFKSWIASVMRGYGS